MKKKIVTMLLLSTFVLNLCACGSSDRPTVNSVGMNGIIKEEITEESSNTVAEIGEAVAVVAENAIDETKVKTETEDGVEADVQMTQMLYGEVVSNDEDGLLVQVQPSGLSKIQKNTPTSKRSVGRR